MRQVYALLGLVKRWGPARVDAACARALEAEAVSVSLIGRMLEASACVSSDRVTALRLRLLAKQTGMIRQLMAEDKAAARELDRLVKACQWPSRSPRWWPPEVPTPRV